MRFCTAVFTLLVMFLVAGSIPSGRCLAQTTCPGAVVGDLTKAPEISFTDIAPGVSTVRGKANNVDARKTRVVLWALTNFWYVQPFTDQPYTTICSDGSWSNTTHPWSRMVALLVDSSYVMAGTRYNHPALDPGVIGWTEYPPVRPDMPIRFSGYSWGPKSAEARFGPGPNYFSADSNHVWVDDDGIHLRTIYENGKWTCSEVYLLQSLGYGVYTFQIGSRIDSLDPQAVLGIFLYEGEGLEVDFEFSQALATPHNAQYVIQPWWAPGNILRYPMPALTYSTHRMEWRAGFIRFTSWSGLSPEPPPDSIINTWTYTGGDNPPPGGERLRFNLWLFNGNAPQRGDEVVIRSFSFARNLPGTVMSHFDHARGWNLVSVPWRDSTYSKAALFPGAVSAAFSFTNGYQQHEMLQQGAGYWLKFAESAHDSLSGSECLIDTVAVKAGWNLIGSISEPVAVSDIVSLDSGLVLSQFWSYAGRYISADTIVPGNGYWVKASQDAQIVLGVPSAASSAYQRPRIMILLK